MCLNICYVLIADERKVEENSGIEFPGSSLELYVGSSLTMEDHDF